MEMLNSKAYLEFGVVRDPGLTSQKILYTMHRKWEFFLQEMEGHLA